MFEKSSPHFTVAPCLTFLAAAHFSAAATYFLLLNILCRLCRNKHSGVLMLLLFLQGTCFFCGLPAKFHLGIDLHLSASVCLLISSIWLQNMSLHIIPELQIQNMLDLVLDPLVLNRETISTRRSRLRGIQSALPM